MKYLCMSHTMFYEWAATSTFHCKKENEIKNSEQTTVKKIKTMHFLTRLNVLYASLHTFSKVKVCCIAYETSNRVNMRCFKGGDP